MTTKKKGIVQHIWCSAGIYKKMEDVFTSFILSQLQNDEVSEYVVYLSTGGGSPFSGINLYNFLKSIPQETTVYNMGNVDSAGVQFFLGFKNRYGVENCSFMIHQASQSKSVLRDWFNVFDLQTEMDKLNATDTKTHAIIHAETKDRSKNHLTTQEIMAATLHTKTFHAEAALAHGIIDKIERPTLPTSGMFYITDQYLATLPG